MLARVFKFENRHTNEMTNTTTFCFTHNDNVHPIEHHHQSKFKKIQNVQPIHTETNASDAKP